MKVLVVSDTHGSGNAIKKVKHHLNSVDVIMHLGDDSKDVMKLAEGFNGEVYSVKGNCDLISNAPLERIAVVDGVKFFMTHGHRYNIKFSMNSLRYKALEEEADVVLFGHTHFASIDNVEGAWFINPGSPALPRGGKASIAVIEINDGIVRPSLITL